MHFDYRPELLDPSCFEDDRPRRGAGAAGDDG